MGAGFIGWHVMQVDMYCWNLVDVVLSFMRISVVGGHV